MKTNKEDENNMDEQRTGSGFGTQSASDTGSTSLGQANKGIASATETCAHCGQPLHRNAGLEEFLGRIGITDEMINNLKTQIQNVDFEEYFNTAREYLKTAGDRVKTSSDKASKFAKDNPGKVAAGMAVLAVGAGLLINSLRDRD
jgi:hypothetical protein